MLRLAASSVLLLLSSSIPAAAFRLTTSDLSAGKSSPLAFAFGQPASVLPHTSRSNSALARSSPTLRSSPRRSVLCSSILNLACMEAASPPMGLDEWFKTNGYVIKQSSSMGGSSWSSGGKYTAEDGTEFFVKTARQSAATMFAGEALGLQAMYATKTLRIPKVFTYGDDGKGGSYIVMEFLPLGRGADQAQFGEALARMHLAECEAPEAKAGQFGFPVHNTIGGTSQPNTWDSDWVKFFREQRIGHQLKLADSPELDRLWAKALASTNNLEDLFQGITVKPSVLHGDLWSGNCAAAEGKACIFDPATYYGHHEAEWGMSWCASFGGKFWEGYRSVIPEDPGFQKRAVLYELYHKLNHYNLFGGGYLMDSQSLLSRLSK